MERTELQYLADFLATSFTDFGLMHDYQLLAEREQGVILIDARRGKENLRDRPFQASDCVVERRNVKSRNPEGNREQFIE